MEFFIPNVSNKKQADEVFQNISKFAEECLGWKNTNRKIYSLSYVHKRKKYQSIVGQMDERVNEKVIAILESNTYLVCTTNNGFKRGTPIMVGKKEASNIIDFE